MLDENQNEVSSPYLEMSDKKVSLTLPVLKKRTVPFTFDFINVPNDFNLDTLNYEITPEEIEIAGPSTSIANMTELHLGYIDLRMLKPDALMIYELPLPVGYISVEDIGEVE